MLYIYTTELIQMKLILNKDQNLFITSDSHHSHKNICRGTSTWDRVEDKTRDFKTIDEMNEAIVNGINSMVGENDLLLHLGDWSFGGIENVFKFRNQIICKNIHILPGNHDHFINSKNSEINSLFASINRGIINLRVIRNLGSSVEKYTPMVLSHFPIMSWENLSKGHIHLHGHVHLNKQNRHICGKMLDVGVDGNDMKPHKLDDIIQIMNTRKIDSPLFQDHHNYES